MTGEVTLQGRVLPIGGLKQKVLAAHAAGLTDVVIPERNRADLDDVPEDVRGEMTFHPVLSIDEVLEVALEPEPAALAAHAAGLTDVIIPERNRADIDDIPEDVRNELTFHPVMTLDEVLALALEPSRPLHAVS